MRRLLVTGASGFIGWHVCNKARDEWDVTGTTFTQKLDIPGVNVLRIDLSDREAVSGLFESVRPDAFMHLGCMSKPADVLAQPERSRAVNVDASLHISELCAKNDIPMVFTSTGLVFDGLAGNYTEDSHLNPPNLYGEQKAEAESGILERHPGAVICRLSWTYGPPTGGNQSFIQPILEKVRAGGVQEEFADIYSSPSSVRAVMGGFFRLLENETGIYHLGGMERLSRFEFVRILFEVFELPENLLKPRYLKDVDDGVTRAPDTSMDTSKAMKLGYDPLPPVEELRMIREQIKGL